MMAMVNKYAKLNAELTEIQKKLRTEERLKFPSPDALESNADRIITLIKDGNIRDARFKNWSFGKIYKLKMFIADLIGTLYQDYNRRNKRYRKNWVVEKEKIDEIIGNFRTEFIDTPTAEKL